MAIPKSFIQQLLLHCDIEDVISSYVPLKREGKNQKAIMSVSLGENTFNGCLSEHTIFLLLWM